MTPRGAAGASAKAFVLFAAALVVAGCTSLVPLSPPTAGDAISGRLALRVDAIGQEPARAMSAAFDLRGTPGDGVLALSTPLGSTLGQARWRGGSVTLTTPRETRRYTDLAEMTRDVLGESVPVEAWFDWLRGRPWSGASSSAEAHGFGQLGWSVDISGLAEGTVVATRNWPAPRVTARVRVEPE